MKNQLVAFTITISMVFSFVALLPSNVEASLITDLAGPDATFRDVCWHPSGDFALAVGNGSSANAIYRYETSDNSWVELGGGAAEVLTAIDYQESTGKFFVLGKLSMDNVAVFTTDGYSDLVQHGSSETFACNDLKAGSVANTFMAVGGNGAAKYWNGISWCGLGGIGSDNNLTSLDFNGTHFFIVGYNQSSGSGASYYITEGELQGAKYTTHLIHDAPNGRLNAIAWNDDAPEGSNGLVAANGELFKLGNPEIWEDTGISPSPRAGNGLAYDSTNNKVILFGGENNAIRNNETWSYDFSSNKWRNMNPAFSPSARDGCGMIYDSKNKNILLFGGSYDGCSFMNDTWAYNLTSNIWTNLNPATAPLPRWAPAMVYDSFNQKTILFGGHNGTYFDDTWTYDFISNTWMNMNPSVKPSPRYCHDTMVYHSTSNKIVLFGGDDGTFDDETWTYDVASNIWTNMNPAIAPSPRELHGMAYDSKNNKIVLFGGEVISDINGETWNYDLATNTWMNTNPLIAPSPRYHIAMVYNSANNRIILFGGYDENYSYISDTWAYEMELNLWTEKISGIKPSNRNNHAMAYDGSNNKVVLFGGYSNGDLNGETLTYDSISNTWANKNPITKPPKRWYHTMAFDSMNGRVVLFGGLGDFGAYLNDTWTYDSASNAWENRNPSTAPSPRGSHAMAYDSENNKLVLFGGRKDSTFYGDTWTYDFSSNTWTNMTPSTAPTPRDRHAMVYDSMNKKIILFGGISGGTSNGETWTYDTASNLWTNMTPTTSPSPRSQHAMAYDSKNERTVLFGGSGNNKET